MHRRWTIRPVSYEERVGSFRIVNDADGMGKALIEYCDPGSVTFNLAAQALLDLSADRGDPEDARDAFIAALEDAGVFVRGVA
ncbi:hypothetical protein [Paracoccus sp. KR1-242]|uniref:hypothetical protein n=1 Tax=Paracoccus sp. KR1-242 TaxID=3410028 RepID=UPI003C0CCDD8